MKWIILFFLVNTCLATELKTIEKLVAANCAKASLPSSCEKAIRKIHKNLTLAQINEKMPSLKVDGIFTLYLVKNPKDFVRKIYCYYVYKHIIVPSETFPEEFAYVVQGASFSRVEKDTYNLWLKKDKQGLICQNNVKKVIGKMPLPMNEDLFHHKKYVLFLNPISFLENGVGESFQKIGTRIYNHERLHLVYAENQNRIHLKELWSNISEEKRKLFISKHHGYNFLDEDTLMKEFFSYSFENDPQEGEKLISP